jgi:hypothetical protein
MNINSKYAVEMSQEDLRKHNDKKSTYYSNSALFSREWSASCSGHCVPGVQVDGTRGVIWEMSLSLSGIELLLSILQSLSLFNYAATCNV